MRRNQQRFEADAIWQWFLENERRFRRYNSNAPECHRGRWHSASIALVGPEPRETPRSFAPRNADDFFTRCQEWFSYRAHPTYFSDRLLRPMLSWIPPIVAKKIGTPGQFVSVSWSELREFLDARVVMLDVVKVSTGVTEHNQFPTMYFRNQMRRLLDPTHPLRLVLAYHRRAIEEVIDLAETAGATDIQHWTGTEWRPVLHWANLRTLLAGTTHPIVATTIPGKPWPVVIVMWHGWRCERFANPSELPTIAP